jgi:hypothetical protein
VAPRGPQQRRGVGQVAGARQQRHQVVRTRRMVRMVLRVVLLVAVLSAAAAAAAKEGRVRWGGSVRRGRQRRAHLSHAEAAARDGSNEAAVTEELVSAFASTAAAPACPSSITPSATLTAC